MQNKLNVNHVKKLFFSFLSFCFLVSCGDEVSYPKALETFIVSNKTDTSFIVAWDNNMFTNILPFDTVKPLEERIYYADNKNYDLWLTENQLNELFSKLKIFRAVESETIYVDKKNYSDLNLWYHHKNSYSRMFGNIDYYNSHFIEITNEMFSK